MLVSTRTTNEERGRNKENEDYIGRFTYDIFLDSSNISKYKYIIFFFYKIKKLVEKIFERNIYPIFTMYIYIYMHFNRCTIFTCNELSD